MGRLKKAGPACEIPAYRRAPGAKSDDEARNRAGTGRAHADRRNGAATHHLSKQMTVRFSGWQRIGIVVSVIWFVGFAGYVVAHRQDDALYDKLLLTCAEGLQRDFALLESAKTAEEREQRRQEYGNKYSKCLNDAHVSSFRFGLNNDPLQAIPLILAVDLGMIVIGWLIAWCVVMVFRGMRAGFT